MYRLHSSHLSSARSEDAERPATRGLTAKEALLTFSRRRCASFDERGKSVSLTQTRQAQELSVFSHCCNRIHSPFSVFLLLLVRIQMRLLGPFNATVRYGYRPALLSALKSIPIQSCLSSDRLRPQSASSQGVELTARGLLSDALWRVPRLGYL